MRKVNFRSAITGRFVRALFAKCFPVFTVRERRAIRVKDLALDEIEAIRNAIPREERNWRDFKIGGSD